MSTPRMAGRLAGMNHAIHGPLMATPSDAARLRQRRFWAAEVRKRLLEWLDVCMRAETKKVPILVREGSLGLEPDACGWHVGLLVVSFGGTLCEGPSENLWTRSTRVDQR